VFTCNQLARPVAGNEQVFGLYFSHLVEYHLRRVWPVEDQKEYGC
jgi:hypothetical protein